MGTDQEVVQAVLGELEWSRFVPSAHPDCSGFRRACPVCHRPQPLGDADPAGGHAEDCRLAAALAASTPAPPVDPQALPRLLDQYRHAVAVQTASRIRYGRWERPAEKVAEIRARLEQALRVSVPPGSVPPRSEPTEPEPTGRDAPLAPAAVAPPAPLAEDERVAQLEQRLAAAYEIVGSLAYALGQFQHPQVVAALDYLAGFEGAPDPLPFPSLRPYQALRSG